MVVCVCVCVCGCGGGRSGGGMGEHKWYAGPKRGLRAWDRASRKAFSRFLSNSDTLKNIWKRRNLRREHSKRASLTNDNSDKRKLKMTNRKRTHLNTYHSGKEHDETGKLEKLNFWKGKSEN